MREAHNHTVLRSSKFLHHRVVLQAQSPRHLSSRILALAAADEIIKGQTGSGLNQAKVLAMLNDLTNQIVIVIRLSRFEAEWNQDRSKHSCWIRYIHWGRDMRKASAPIMRTESNFNVL